MRKGRVLGASSAVGALAVAASALATVFSNTSTITIPTGSNTATPYPSSIVVSGLSGSVTDVNATIDGFVHAFPDEVGVLMVGPTGAKAELMDGLGDGGDVSDLTFVFDDAAAGPAPCSDPLVGGTFKPTDCYPAFDAYPGPAPSGPHAELLSAFNGTNPNGTWNLYVADFIAADGGSISRGWSIDVLTDQSTAVGLQRFSARRVGAAVELRWRTGSDAAVAGFNVYRVTSGRSVRVNATLIPARGGVAGAAYRLLDRQAGARTLERYRLEIVDLSGARRSAAFAAVAR